MGVGGAWDLDCTVAGFRRKVTCMTQFDGIIWNEIKGFKDILLELVRHTSSSSPRIKTSVRATVPLRKRSKPSLI